MKVNDLSIGNIYKNKSGKQIIYIGVINYGFYIGLHDFNGINNLCGMLCTDKEVENLVTEIR